MIIGGLELEKELKMSFIVQDWRRQPIDNVSYNNDTVPPII